MSSTAEFNLEAYRLLVEHYGKLRWWKADNAFEVAVGAVLTQRTLWKFVEKSIENLKKSNLFAPEAILAEEDSRISELIKPSGFPNSKTRKLKNLCRFIKEELEGEIENLKNYSLNEARDKLLSVKGIGPETADSILSYGLNFPVLVVDAYTFRIYERHGKIPENCSYEELQEIASEGIVEKDGAAQEYHALLVETAKDFCKKKKPLCRISGVSGECPMEVLFDE